MILETKLQNLDNKPIKVNKKSPPRSINKDLTQLYFTAMFIGAKNSGKSYGLVKLLKFYENEPIKDSENNTLNGGPPANLLINQGVRDNVSGHTTRAPPGRVRTDNQTVPALCHNH